MICVLLCIRWVCTTNKAAVVVPLGGRSLHLGLVVALAAQRSVIGSAPDADFGLTGVSRATIALLSGLMVLIICPESAAYDMTACALSAMPSLER